MENESTDQRSHKEKEQDREGEITHDEFPNAAEVISDYADSTKVEDSWIGPLI